MSTWDHLAAQLRSIVRACAVAAVPGALLGAWLTWASYDPGARDLEGTTPLTAIDVAAGAVAIAGVVVVITAIVAIVIAGLRMIDHIFDTTRYSSTRPAR